MFDTILKLSYPYISESKGWTCMRTNLLQYQQELKIKIKPQYVPMGEEDRTRLTIGVNENLGRSYKVDIWRTQDEYQQTKIHISGDLLTGKVIATNEMEIRLNIGYITLSSTGPASQYQGGCLGQYCLDSSNGYYIQTTTE